MSSMGDLVSPNQVQQQIQRPAELGQFQVGSDFRLAVGAVVRGRFGVRRHRAIIAAPVAPRWPPVKPPMY
jgi:hypothetical protein